MIVPEEKNDEFDDNLERYDNYVVLNIGPDGAEFKIKLGEEKLETLKTCSNGLEEGVRQTYWWSYDKDGKKLKYGKGHTMDKTTLMSYAFEDSSYDKFKLFLEPNPNCPPTVLLYGSLKDCEEDKINKGSIDYEPLILVNKEPLTFTPSPILKEFEPVELDELDQADYTLPNHLPSECKQIFNDIKNIKVLEPHLINQIRNSIETEGLKLNEVLKAKSYLRITIGENRGNSPGCPNVLEIWPAGAESPIHNHGRCSAVIKVLHGSIQCSIFNKITNPPAKSPELLDMFVASEGDYTWMNDHWFQTHQLKNVSDDYCATLQCYQYAPEDQTHYPQFDYYKHEELAKFEPGSDLTFDKMKKIVAREWEEIAQNEVQERKLADIKRRITSLNSSGIQTKDIKNLESRVKRIEDLKNFL